MLRPVRWIVRAAVTLVAVYMLLFGAVLTAMLRPPDQFGLVMKHIPPALVWCAPWPSHVAVGAQRSSLGGRARTRLHALDG